jgi:hypothetical protein
MAFEPGWPSGVYTFAGGFSPAPSCRERATDHAGHPTLAGPRRPADADSGCPGAAGERARAQQVLAEGEAKGRAEGEAKGRAEGEARSVLAFLEARGLAVSDAERSRILGCTDLDRWIRRAVSVERTAQLFE